MKLISSTVSGLGNRIKCLVGSLYLTKDVKVWWPRILDKGMMNNFRAKIEPFSDLFESDIVQIQNRVELQQLIDSGYEYRAAWRWHDDIHFDYTFDKSNIDLKIKMYDLMTEYLKPSEKVREIYDSRIEAVKSCDYGCFIRTGDVQHPDYKAQFCSPEVFKVDKNDRAFVVGDSPLVYEYFMDYPNVVCYLEDNYIYGGWPAHLANAMLLGQMRNIRMPRSSTYSDLIFAYSKFEADVRIIRPNVHGVGGRRGMYNDLRRLKKERDSN